MILDVTRGKSHKEREHIWDCALRYYVKNYRHTPEGFPDLHIVFPNSPYHGESMDSYCEFADDSEHDCENDYEYCNIIDLRYDKWFDDLISIDDEIMVQKLIEKQHDLGYLYFTGKTREHSIRLVNDEYSIKILKYLKSNPSLQWDIARSVLSFSETVYFQNYDHCCLTRLHSDTHMPSNRNYACNHLGWKRILHSDEEYRWLKENSTGFVFTTGDGIYMEDKLTYMEWKLMFHGEKIEDRRD
jgi:hypothetical protein